MTFARVSYFYPVLYFLVFAIGVFVGLEIPLLLRILKDKVEFKELVSRVLAFDYIGALLASILFPILFVPKLGLVRTSLIFGMLNAGVALWGTWLLRPLIKGSIFGLRLRAYIVLGLLLVGLVKANTLTSLAEDEMFADEIVYTKDTPYQRIVITRGAPDFNCSLMATCSSARQTSIATTKPSFIRLCCWRIILAGFGLEAATVWPFVKF